MLKHINLKRGELHIIEDGPLEPMYSGFEKLIESEMGYEAGEYFRFIVNQKDIEIEEMDNSNEYNIICVDAFHRLEALVKKLPDDLTLENVRENLVKFNAIKSAIKSRRSALDDL